MAKLDSAADGAACTKGNRKEHMNDRIGSPAFATATTIMFSSAASLSASEADGKIESSFRQTHGYEAYFKDVKAEAKDGIVTLTGFVAVESHKALAQDTAASLPGVSHVENQLTTKVGVAGDNALATKLDTDIQGVITDEKT